MGTRRQRILFWILASLWMNLESRNIPGCNEQFDLVFVLDGSESLTEYDPPYEPYHTWYTVTNFTQALIRRLPVETLTRVAAVRFATDAILDFDFLTHQSSSGIEKGLRTLDFLGGNTNTAAALRMCNGNVFSSSHGDRENASNVMILITDGLSNIDQEMTQLEANKAKSEKDIEIFVIGVSKYAELAELEGIASEPTDMHVFQVEDFEQLTEIEDSLVLALCGTVPTVEPTKPDWCMEGCLDCTASGACSQCLSGSFFNGSQCAECLPDCVVCNESDSCEICRGSFYWNEASHSCQRCMDNCLICSDGTTCTRCMDGWYRKSVQAACLKCEVLVDLMLVVDSSGSIRDGNPEDNSYDNYQLLKDFVKAFLSRLNVGENATRVGVVRFSTYAKLAFPLNRHFAMKDIHAAIDAMPYGGGFTNTSGGLRLMRTHAFQAGLGERPDIGNMAIVITDGKSNRDANLTIPEANLAKAANITVFVVGVTDQINEVELKSIASKPVDSHYFNSTEIRHLDSIMLQLTNHVCSPDAVHGIPAVDGDEILPPNT